MVTTEQAVKFLETACRNWSRIPGLSKADVEDVRVALEVFCRGQSDADKYREIIEAVGEQEAERLIVCDMGSIEAVHAHLTAIGSLSAE